MYLKKAVTLIFLSGALVSAIALASAPRPATGPLYDVGAALYKAKCASCHGQDGSGNTPAGKKLKVRDLRAPDVQKQADAQLAAMIAQGKGKMPSFEKRLSKEEISQLVTHIRGLKKG